jgi:hypothetical protein
MMGSRVSSRPSQVRMFLRADTPEELVRAQLRNNIFLKGRADYTDVQFVDGQWYCWFLVDVEQNRVFLKQLELDPEETEE